MPEETTGMTPAERPLCFVLMPYGKKRDPTSTSMIDFNAIYEHAIRPAIESVGLEPIRSDMETCGGIIQKQMFERLILCSYAVADLTTANANVFYELGVRHALRPKTTLPIVAKGQPLPFDVGSVQALQYRLGARNAFEQPQIDAMYHSLRERLACLIDNAAEKSLQDSPVFQLLDGDPREIDHLKTDNFRDQITLEGEHAERISNARIETDDAKALAALEKIERELRPLKLQRPATMIDLLLSYRAHSGWQQMIDLFKRVPIVVRRTWVVREQAALAYNRRAGGRAEDDGAARREDRKNALRLLRGVLAERGPSPETLGLIGRVHKDEWVEAREAGRRGAAGYLNKAIDSYRDGFEADFRDAYPGINLLTLLDAKGTKASLSERDALVPVVRYAAKRRIASGLPNYWDHATLFELETLCGNEDAADSALDDALAAEGFESWMANSTANNLRLIAACRRARGEECAWVDGLVATLEGAAKP